MTIPPPIQKIHILWTNPSWPSSPPTPADLGLLLSLHTVPRVGVEPSLQTQVGLVLSPHGLRRGLGTGASVNQIISFILIQRDHHLVIWVPSAQVQVGLPPSAHLGLTLSNSPPSPPWPGRLPLKKPWTNQR